MMLMRSPECVGKRRSFGSVGLSSAVEKSCSQRRLRRVERLADNVHIYNIMQVWAHFKYNEVERQGKANKSTTPRTDRSFFSKKRRAVLGEIGTHDNSSLKTCWQCNTMNVWADFKASYLEHPSLDVYSAYSTLLHCQHPPIKRDGEMVTEETEVTGVIKSLPEYGFTWRECCEERQWHHH